MSVDVVLCRNLRGSDFLSGRRVCKNIIDHQEYLRYLEMPVGNMVYIWGDNKSIIKSSTVPKTKLHNRHNISSFHYVRSMISQGYINMQHIGLKWNFSDILTNNWSYQSSYHKLIQPVFHHSGNTASLFLRNTLEVYISIAKESIFGILRSNKKIVSTNYRECNMHVWHVYYNQRVSMHSKIKISRND